MGVSVFVGNPLLVGFKGRPKGTSPNLGSPIPILRACSGDVTLPFRYRGKPSNQKDANHFGGPSSSHVRKTRGYKHQTNGFPPKTHTQITRLSTSGSSGRTHRVLPEKRKEQKTEAKTIGDFNQEKWWTPGGSHVLTDEDSFASHTCPWDNTCPWDKKAWSLFSIRNTESPPKSSFERVSNVSGRCLCLRPN